MLSAILLGLSASASVYAFPRWYKRQEPSASYCIPTTSYVPIITEIPYCNGNICPTNTIISQGQPVITSSLISASTSGTAGQVYAGTTVQNNGAFATNVDFSSFTLCATDCVVGGNTYSSGTVFFSTSSLVAPSTTTIIGGQTLTDTTGIVTVPTAVTSYVSPPELLLIIQKLLLNGLQRGYCYQWRTACDDSIQG